MRLFKLFLFYCLLANLGFSQKPVVPLNETRNIPILKFKSQMNVGGYNEKIIVKKFLDDESKLLAVTNFGIKLWNVKTAEIIKSYPHEIQDLDKSVCIINHDGTKAIVTEPFDLSLKSLFRKKKVSATVYDLETGKQISVLERPIESIRYAVWTKDGKTLITFSKITPSSQKTEISFWNAENLEFRGSLTTTKGIYLTNDGNSFITISPITENTFGYKTETQNSVKIWDINSLKVEKSFPFVQEKSLGTVKITPDESLLIAKTDKGITLLNLETENQKSFATKETNKITDFNLSSDKKFLRTSQNNKILIWEVEGNNLPKLEITSRPKNDKQHFAVIFRNFSDDGKYAIVSHLKYRKALAIFAYDLSDEIEYYNLASGQIDSDLKNYYKTSNTIFSADNSFGITPSCENAVFYDNKTQEKLYTFPLNCKTYTYTDTDGNGNSQTNSINYNDDIVVFHPKKNISLVAKDEWLELYGIDAEQGQLQKLFTPKELEKKSYNLSYPGFEYSLKAGFSHIESENPVDSSPNAGFLLDGNYAFAASKDKKSVIIWEVDLDLIK